MNVNSSRRSDAELEAMFSERGTWQVHGDNDGVIGTKSSLQAALISAAETQAANQIVSAIVKMPDVQIKVDENQIARLLLLFNLVDSQGRMVRRGT